ncbi:MAG: lamin tail domain-containing protein [Candidatus Woesearchaeota archaeon]|jgi:hypothetical protein|nr:lamin tail domain-containing protein [Candidatus Woesearchaeota archaeon]MDP7622504.1 lamin tail domain-containing protein [Candidatus Woesearchaeota archaeon]HJN56598.1 lamin tail domain-containing protein [Candidatus Woesearchaeota archaeon]|tara:strand:+ start:34810 stop:36582 length:1773 start_codon:yes stop_codon:yes gene_type:complete
MKVLLILIFLLISIILTLNSEALIINEIMADTIADESLNEWIELYNDDAAEINVSGWIIGDDNDNDTIEGGLYNEEGTIIPAFGYAIITDEATRVYNNFNVSNNAVRLYIDDSSIGGYGLSNSGETIYLYNNNLVDKRTYNKTSEDLSWAYVNGSLHKSDPTPGFSNNGSIILEYGCDYQSELILPKTVFNNSSEFYFKVRASKAEGTSTNFTLRADIEDLNGKIIKEYKPFTNKSITRQRTSSEYTPNLDEGKSYIIESNITVWCDDTDSSNDVDSRIITIKGKPLQEKSSIDITKVYDLGNDKEAKFGQIIRIRLNAYKGNTNKESIAAWIEDNKGSKLSKQSKTNLELKYTNYSLTLPIQIKPNCNEKYDNDDYTIKVSGLDSEDQEEIEIADLTDSMCEVNIVKEKKSSLKNFEFELMDFNNNIEAGKEFNTRVMLDNNNNKDINIKLWSYAYRGSKSYSGEREDNMKEFVLERNSMEIVELSNMVEKADPGNYKLKVLINKDNQKTNNQITKDIVVNNKIKNNPDSSNNEIKKTITEENIVEENKNTILNYGIVYESSTEKAKNLIPVFLIALSVLLNIVLICRR